MNKMHEKQGYILVLTLLVLSITIMIVMQIFQQSTIQHFFDKSVIARQKAKQLALSGLQLAMSQLSIEKEKEPEGKAEQQNQKKPKQSSEQKLIQKLLPSLNQLQTFVLKEDVDGIDGSIAFCMTAEDGKLNINQLFDFAKKEFVGGKEGRKTIQSFFSALKSVSNKDFFGPFENFLKKRQNQLYDVTQLMEIKEFQDYFKGSLFYDPERVIEKKGSRIVFLNDLFTVAGSAQKMNPWILSHSISTIFGLQSRAWQDQKKGIEELVKGVTLTNDLQKMWDQYLVKIYGKEFKSLPKDLTALLTAGLSFKNFTILSYGTVDKITQKLAALIERINDTTFLIRKLYWL